jgi:hypothetical protein
MKTLLLLCGATARIIFNSSLSGIPFPYWSLPLPSTEQETEVQRTVVSRLSCGLPTDLLPWNLSSSTFFGIIELSIRTILPAHCYLFNLMYFTFYYYGINAKYTDRRRVPVVVTVTMIPNLGPVGSFS